MKKVKIITTICSLVMAVAMLGFATFAALKTTTTLTSGTINVAGAADFELDIQRVDGNANVIPGSLIEVYTESTWMPNDHGAINASIIQANSSNYRLATLDVAAGEVSIILEISLKRTGDIDLVLSSITIGSLTAVFYNDAACTDPATINGTEINSTVKKVYAFVTIGSLDGDPEGRLAGTNPETILVDKGTATYDVEITVGLPA